MPFAAADLRLPQRLVHGMGAVMCLPELLEEAGIERALFCCDPHVAKLPEVHPLLSELEKHRIEVCWLLGPSSEPSIEDCEALLQKAEALPSAGAVIALGGGSTMDLCKCVAACVATKLSPESLAGMNSNFPALPIFAIPTTAGSGSECTDGAVLTARTGNAKTIFRSPALVPRVVVLDPRLTFSCNDQVTAMAGVDALTHAIESLLCVDHPSSSGKGRTPLTAALARSAILLLVPALVKFASGDRSERMRADLLYGSHMAGNAFAGSGLHVVHALAYALNAQSPCAHGRALAQFLPACVAAIQPVRKDEIDWIADVAAGCDVPGVDAASRLAHLLASLRCAVVDWSTIDLTRLTDTAVRNERLCANAPGAADALIASIARHATGCGGVA